MDPRNSRLVRHVRAWPRRVLVTITTLIVVLVAARIALPFVVKHQVNARLASIPGYSGRVEGIGIGLLRGAYSLEDIAIYRVNGAAREPFFLARHIDFSVAWRELFHRKIVSEIKVEDATINFVAAVTREASQTDIDRRWQDVVNDLFPLEVSHLEVTNSAVRYQDLTKAPHVDLFIKSMHLLATGLRNRGGEGGQEFPAEISVEGDTLGGGRLKLFISAEPLALQPHFHLSAKIDNVNLPDLNESLQAYANVDVGRGTFRMAAEMAGKDGGFQGYVKPFFENLDFKNLADAKKGAFTRIWEKVVAGLAWLVKNKPRDQVGTRIPFEGRFGDSKVGLWVTVTNLFRHGFIRAFNPTVEGSVHADNVAPTGKSVSGKDGAETKDDANPWPKTVEGRGDQRAEAPAGRPPSSTTRPSK